MKTCSLCKQTKPLTDFYFRAKNTRQLPCYEPSCRDCNNARSVRYMRSEKGLPAKIYARQRNSSKQRNQPMPNYTLEEFRAWMYAQCDFKTLYENWVKSGYEKALAPSVDRVDNNLPYLFSNIRLVTWRENHKSYAEDVKNHVNCSVKNLRPVIQLDLNGKILNEYPSGALAARATNARTSGIMAAAQGVNDTSKGFRWAYKDEYNPNDLKWKMPVPKPILRVVVIQLDEHKNFIAKHHSMTAIEETLGFSRRGIARNLNKPRKIHGFYWQDEKFFCESNNVSMEEAAQMWNGSSLQLINKTSPLLIGFGGNS